MPAQGARNPDRDPSGFEAVGEGGAAASGEEQTLVLEADVLVTPLSGEIPPFWARADEVSSQGLFVRTHRRLPEDALLMLEVVFRDLSLPKLRLDAHVVHCIPGAGFGCRFVAGSRQLTHRLAEIIAEVGRSLGGPDH